jgi:hypothetical protein
MIEQDPNPADNWRAHADHRSDRHCGHEWYGAIDLPDPNAQWWRKTAYPLPHQAGPPARCRAAKPTMVSLSVRAPLA